MAPLSPLLRRWLVDTALFLLLLALPGCQGGKATVCTVEVTEAKGIFHGTVTGVRPRADLEREALRGACGQLCAAQAEAAQAVGCVARCSVDAEAGKIGKRTTCTEGAPR